MLNFCRGLAKKVLNYFFLNESERVYINQLARILKADSKNLHRVLIALEKEGILSSEFKGKERYFFSSIKNPLYKNYKAIFLASSGLEQLIKEQLKNLSGLVEAYIFGSYAHGRYGGNSDIDLLLVGSHKALSAQRLIHRIQRDVGREINIVNLTSEEFKKRKQNKDQFITKVFSAKVIKLI